jgi:peptide/nickel transport system substrate-binding protein
MKRRRSGYSAWAKFIPILAALLFIIACGTAAPDPAAPGSQATPPPAMGGTPAPTAAPGPTPVAGAVPAGNILSVGLQEVGTMQAHPRMAATPTLQIAQTTIAEGLVVVDSELQVVPWLLESWNISEDSLTWTFNIRQGVQFHHGYGEMTAEDVVWSYQEWPHSVHPSASQIGLFWQDAGGSVEITDPYTIRLTTAEPWADVTAFNFLMSPAGAGTYVASKAQNDELGMEGANRRIATTGPWELWEHRTAEFWRLRAVPDHWRQPPHFAELVIWEIPEESARIAGFQTGRLDTFLMEFDSIPTVQNVRGARLMQIPGGNTMGLNIYGQYHVSAGTPDQETAFDPALPWVSADPDPTSEEWQRAAKVRRALAIAIDRETLVDTLVWGYGAPATVRYFGGHENMLEGLSWEYDPDLARQLLAEAGYPDGISITLSPVALRPGEITTCEAIATMWRDAGIRANLEVVAYGAALRPRIVGRTYQGATCHATRWFLSPISAMNNFLSRSQGSVFNVGADHPWLDEHILRAQRTVDPALRDELTAEIGRFVFENAISDIGLYTIDTIWPVGPDIEEWVEHVVYSDLRYINGYEYIRPRQ